MSRDDQDRSRSTKTSFSLVRFLGSLRFTLILLGILGFLAAVASLIPLPGSYESFRAFLIAGVGRAFIWSHLHRPFASPLFCFLLGLFVVNLTLCTWRRIPAVVRMWLSDELPSDEAFKQRCDFRTEGEGGDEQASLEAITSCGYRFVGARTDDGERRLFFRRGASSLLGPQITHIGVLLIIIGGAVGWWAGAEGFGGAEEGESFAVFRPEYYRLEDEVRRLQFLREFYLDVERVGGLRHLDVEEFQRIGRRINALMIEMDVLEADPLFEVNVVSAREERDEQGAVLRWVSHLQIEDEYGVHVDREIEVNSPLSFRGMTLYQHSFETRRQQGSADEEDERVIRAIILREGDSYQPDGLPLHVAALEFFPDFAVVPGADGSPQASSRSDELVNPALRAVLHVDGEEPQRMFLFRGPPYSIHDDPHSRWALRLSDVVPDDERGGWLFALEVIDRRPPMDETTPVVAWTGLSIQYDPGLPLVWIGSLVMSIGLVMAFCIDYRRLMLIVSHEGHWCLVGVPSRFSGLFEHEFARVVACLRRTPDAVSGVSLDGGEA